MTIDGARSHRSEDDIPDKKRRFARPHRDRDGRNDDRDGRKEHHDRHEIDERDLPKHKTSAAAAFALIFGVIALLSGLTGILSPVAVVVGIIGVILGIIGIKRSGKPRKTGKGVAIGGLVLSIIGLLLGAAIIAGAVTVLNNQNAVNRIEKQLDKAKKNIPTAAPTK